MLDLCEGRGKFNHRPICYEDTTCPVCDEHDKHEQTIDELSQTIEERDEIIKERDEALRKLKESVS